jgi:phosphonate metabolism transcriptional regulator PhnF
VNLINLSNSIEKTSNSENGAPLWRQIASKLESDIESGARVPGNKLPTESEIAADFSTNRHTVRRALAWRQGQGLLETTQGRGSFVRRPILTYKVGRRTRFTDGIAKHVADSQTRTLTIDVRLAEPHVAAALRLKMGALVVYLERLGLVNNQPIGLSRHYFDFNRFPTFDVFYQRHKSITRTLLECGVPDYERKRTRILCRLPSRIEAKLLNVPKHVPLLVTRSWNVDGMGRPLEYGESHIPSDRIEIEIEAEPRQNSDDPN